MKVILIDDEKAMHLIMKRMLNKVPGIDVVGTYQETAEAYAYLEQHDADLIFIDINMPKESGIEFAVRLRERGSQVKLVFVTSHKEYALSAFDVYAYDYIVKPVVQERLQHTIQRVLAERHPNTVAVSEDAPPIPIRFNCLGSLEIRDLQNHIIKWKSSKSAELFGYLLIHQNRQVSRARLIEDIFGDMPLKNAEIYLNTTVYQLRKLLDAYGLKDRLHSEGHYYALDLSHVSVDLHLFEEGCKQMPVVTQTNIEQAIALEQLYAGELFGDRAFSWARHEIERYSLMYVSFTQRLCSALLNNGDANTAIRLLMKVQAQSELDEETIKLLMYGRAQQKNREALTQLYNHFTGILVRELGISASMEITTLYKQLLLELES